MLTEFDMNTGAVIEIAEPTVTHGHRVVDRSELSAIVPNLQLVAAETEPQTARTLPADLAFVSIDDFISRHSD